jgi:hypothetical protein
MCISMLNYLVEINNKWFLLVFMCVYVDAQAGATKEKDNLAYQADIVNPHNFNYVYNPKFEICGTSQSEKLFLLIYVKLLIYSYMYLDLLVI